MAKKQTKTQKTKEFFSSVSIGELVRVILTDDLFVDGAWNQIGKLTDLNIKNKLTPDCEVGANSILGNYCGFSRDNDTLYINVSIPYMGFSKSIAEDKIKEVQVFKPTETYKF